MVSLLVVRLSRFRSLALPCKKTLPRWLQSTDLRADRIRDLDWMPLQSPAHWQAGEIGGNGGGEELSSRMSQRKMNVERYGRKLMQSVSDRIEPGTRVSINEDWFTFGVDIVPFRESNEIREDATALRERMAEDGYL